MRGANINAAATGLMQGIQYMDERNRRIKQDERQARLDNLQEQDYARRAELQGLTLQQKQTEMADYQANAPLRDRERQEKTRVFDAADHQRKVDESLFNLAKGYEQNKSLDGLKAVNDLFDDGLDFVGGDTDPATGAITIRRKDTVTGEEFENTYTNFDDLLTKARQYSSPSAWMATEEARIKRLQDAIDKASELEAFDKKEGVKSKYEIKKVDKENAGREAVARITANSRLAVAEAKAAIAESRGRGVVESQADRRVQTINLLKTMKDDPSLKYHTNADGKPDYKRPKSYNDQYNEVYSLLYGNDAAPPVAPPAASANPAAAGVTPARPAAQKPAASATASPKPKEIRPGIPYIDLESARY
jgi:hypothetical protein